MGGVLENMIRIGYSMNRVHLVLGKAEDSLPQQAPFAVAILRIDTDSCRSAQHEMEHLGPRLVAGGVLIIGDYGDWQGVRKPVDEYCDQHRLPLLLHHIDHTARMAVKLEREAA